MHEDNENWSSQKREREARDSLKEAPLTLNGLRLCDRAVFGALHCEPSTNFDTSRKLDLTTELRFMGGCK